MTKRKRNDSEELLSTLLPPKRREWSRLPLSSLLKLQEVYKNATTLQDINDHVNILVAQRDTLVLQRDREDFLDMWLKSGFPQFYNSTEKTWAQEFVAFRAYVMRCIDISELFIRSGHSLEYNGEMEITTTTYLQDKALFYITYDSTKSSEWVRDERDKKVDIVKMLSPLKTNQLLKRVQHEIVRCKEYEDNQVVKDEIYNYLHCNAFHKLDYTRFDLPLYEENVDFEK